MEVDWFPPWYYLVPLFWGLATGRWWALPLAVASTLFVAFAILPRDGGEGSYETSIGFTLVGGLLFTVVFVLIPAFWATVGVGMHRGIRQAWLKWGSSSR